MSNNLIGKLVHGAAGITKAITGTGGATDEMIQRRAAICMDCEHMDSLLGVPQCSICLCLIPAKVRIAAEKCPDNPPRW